MHSGQRAPTGSRAASSPPSKLADKRQEIREVVSLELLQENCSQVALGINKTPPHNSGAAFRAAE